MSASNTRIKFINLSTNIDGDYILSGLDCVGNIIAARKYIPKHKKPIKERLETFFVDFFSSKKSDRFINNMLIAIGIIIATFIFLMIIK